MRDKYTRYAELGNKGAQEIGFADMGALWRSGYDMTPAEFEADIERLWQEVKPLYDDLHCYVREKPAQEVRQGQGPREAPPSPRTCSATCGRRSGRNVYDSSSRIRGRARSTSTRSSRTKKYDAVGW